ncbi:histidine triad protein [Spiroplasma sp. TIUS-1]|uniref:HIT family protein n=1 Tax=Spiroplasma sp. TIUS-1 TaxID=216963 RepID=UPI0013975E58|nr:HIT family protein [Spiroplasma sp. TIUS-1]QHX35795.1 histidine triad protein [Spiroplasma sp. TIUS-1]
MDCLFCKILNGTISSKKIYENDYAFAFLDISPVSQGHSLIIPKKHFDNFSESDDLFLSEVSKAAKVVAKLLASKIDGIKGFNYISNEGSEALQMVFHYHLHVIPKYKKNEGFLHNKNIVDPIDIEKSFIQITK